MKLVLYGIMGFDVFLTAAGEKVLNRSSFIFELCRYLILQAKDSCCSIDFFVVTILFCVLWLDSYVLKCQELLLNMILRVYIFPQQQLRMQLVWSSFVNVKFQVLQRFVRFFSLLCQALDFIVFLCVYAFFQSALSFFSFLCVGLHMFYNVLHQLRIQ